MKITVVLGSQRGSGTNKEIEEALRNLPVAHEFDFIRMAETSILPCRVCGKCEKTWHCVISEDENDMFENVLHRLSAADAVMIITPVYTPIPSKLAALFERLMGVSFLNPDKPLKGKKTAIVSYCSSKICDEKEIKMLFQKYLMDDYGFSKVDFEYLNNEPNPNQKYNRSVVEYVKDIVLNMN